MKTIFYFIFALIFWIYKWIPIKQNKVMFIMTHDKYLDGNIGRVYGELLELNEQYSYYWIKKEDSRFSATFKGIPQQLEFFFIKPYHLATAQYIYLDNTFLPMAFMKFSKRVKIVQLWHGTGSIKRFGQDTNKGILKVIEKYAHQSYTHLIVNSRSVTELHRSAFGISENRIFPVGSPRTDFFFKKEEMEASLEEFYTEYPDLVDKKIILYAPTFRDHEIDNPTIQLELDRLRILLDDGYVILLRIHPFIAHKVVLKEKDNVWNVSNYNNLNALLLAADLLITDYSSILFEYSLLNRPMVFFTYDLEIYEQQLRGFYYTYDQFVPGPIVKDSEQVVEVIKSIDGPSEEVLAFKQKYFDFTDGCSAKRVVELVHKS